MEVINQITNVELSKTLKELGVTQNAKYTWDYYSEPGWIWGVPVKDEDTTRAAAFTATELLEILPSCIVINGNACHFFLTKSYMDNNYICCYWGADDKKKALYADASDVSLADTLGECLRKCIENNYITLKGNKYVSAN